MGPFCLGFFSKIGISASAIPPSGVVFTASVLLIRDFLLLVLLLHVTSSQALTASAITSDGTLGTTITQAGATFNITGGNRSGSNLFHSFGLFSVGIGDTANFLNNSGQATSNIIGRVTGGQTSNIAGTIRTTNFTDANLFLINPAGWIFGPTAFLNIGGSFHVSTADYLKLADGAQFHATLARSSVLTSAPVSAFGFLSQNPAGISIRPFHQPGTPSARPNLQVPAGKTVSLVGGDITMEGDPRSNTRIPTILAQDGKIQLASVASPGEVPLDVQGLNPSAFERLGQVSLSRGFIDVTGTQGGGSVVIRGGRLVVDQSRVVGCCFLDPFDNVFTGSSPRIDIAVAGEAVVSNRSEIATRTEGLQHGGGDVKITADSLLVSDSTINSSANSFAGGEVSGSGGDITIAVRELTLIGTPFDAENPPVNPPTPNIYTSTIGQRDGGDITIKADKATMVGGRFGCFILGCFGGSIQSATEGFSATSPTGRGGDISLEVGQLRLDRASIDSQTFGPARGGNISISARDSVVITNRGEVRAVSGANGPGGRLLIDSPSLLIENDAILGSLPFTGFPDSRSGDVVLNVGSLTVRNAQINSNSDFGPSRIFFGLGSNPRPGNITIVATDVTLDKGAISTTALGDSDRGGDITISARRIRLSNGTFITSDIVGSGGNAGNITIHATDTFQSSGSSISTKAESADGGNIQLQVGKLVDLSKSQITASVGAGTGSGGNIVIDPRFVVLDRSQIIANAFGGPGGNVQIVANVFLASPNSVVTASSALSTPGTVNIQAPIVDFSGSLAPLPENTFQATSLLRQSCPGRFTGGKLSSLVVGSREGLPWEPGGFIPSPLFRIEGPSTATTPTGERPDSLAHSSSLLAKAKLHLLRNQGCNQVAP